MKKKDSIYPPSCEDIKHDVKKDRNYKERQNTKTLIKKQGVNMPPSCERFDKWKIYDVRITIPINKGGSGVKKVKEFIVNIAFMFRYSWKVAKIVYLFAVVDIIIQSISPFVYLIIPKYIIDELAGEQRWEYVLRYIILFIGFTFLMKLVKYIFSYFSSKNYLMKIEDGIYKNMFEMQAQYYV